VKCLRAQERWRDYQIFSTFIDGLVDELLDIYGDAALSYDEKLDQRQVLFERSLKDFEDRVQPSFEAMTFQSFRVIPLNNATLMARMRYYHRLPDFQGLLEETGGLRAAVEHLTEGVPDVDDPYDLLPSSPPAEPNGS
jgi:predicted aminopeptidase